ncbi:MAG: hypothetical protein IJU56_00520, partial [Clostridia bacterium]|nr:hypothetical protein [Clostridia bacterium]
AAAGTGRCAKRISCRQGEKKNGTFCTRFVCAAKQAEQRRRRAKAQPKAISLLCLFSRSACGAARSRPGGFRRSKAAPENKTEAILIPPDWPQVPGDSLGV